MLLSLREATQVTRTKAGRRKLRLFACGCCRLIWERLRDPRLRCAVEVAERFTEVQANKEQLTAAREGAMELARGEYLPEAPGAQARTAARMASDAAAPRPF